VKYGRRSRFAAEPIGSIPLPPKKGRIRFLPAAAILLNAWEKPPQREI